jgi:hypothetical protein
MKILKITILLRKGHTDHITFETDLPSPFPVMKYDPLLTMEVQRKLGIQYIRDNFPDIPTTIINTDTGNMYELD